AFHAGLIAPAPPLLTANPNLGSGFTGKNTGTSGSQITKFRSATRADSNASEPSNVGSCTAESIYFTCPPTPIDGTDQWNVYVSANGYGDAGPYLFLETVDEVDLTDTGTGTIASGSHTWTNVAGIAIPPTGHVLTAADVGKQMVVTGAGS